MAHTHDHAGHRHDHGPAKGHDHVHDHDHADDHSGHNHGPGHQHRHGEGASATRLAWAAALTGGFMVAEVVGGLISGSLALLADAGHMLADFGGLMLALVAFRLSLRPADEQRSYGLARLQVLAAFANGVVVLGVAVIIVFEAVHRLFQPVSILTGPMLVVAIGGLLVNLACFAVLHGGDRNNLNMRGALAHVLGDLLGSAGVLVAAFIIMLTGWTPADPIVSALVAALIGKTAWTLIRDSGHILLEGTPTGLEPGVIEADLRQTVPGVASIHHLHVWSITEERPMMTLHACLAPGSDAMAAIRSIKARLHERFDIAHVTVEVEEGECADLPAGRH